MFDKGLEILEKELLSKTKRIQYIPGIQGQRIIDPEFDDEIYSTIYLKNYLPKDFLKIAKQAIILVGDKAGPENHISNLCHELAHFVEIDDERMVQSGWGLKVREVWVYDRMCIEPITNQCTEREIRVAAYQQNLMKHIGIDSPMEEITNSFHWLPDFIFTPLEDGSKAYGGNVNKLNYTEITKSQLRWCAKQATKLMKEFTIERFLSEWNRKIKVLEEYYEQATKKF